jgi:hypothetical protein
MLPEPVDNLRLRYTGQYVAVQATRPDLLRFQGKIGQVKTVNFNGRALVQFDDDSSRGWYDLSPADLQIVERPPPKPAPHKPEPAKTAPKPAAGKHPGQPPAPGKTES